MGLGQQPFNPDLTDNPERRCPVVLLLDTSGSMSGEAIAALNDGVRLFRETLLADEVAAKRVEIAIISFGPVKEETGFVGAESFVAPLLQAGGDTPAGAAILAGIDLLEDRKQQIRAHGVDMYRPWIMLVTDGAPTDNWAAAAEAVHRGEKDRAFAFFTIGVEGANMDILRRIAPPERAPIPLKGLNFRELFLWLSGSLKAVSGSKPGTEVPLQSPVASGWASVS